VSTSEPRPYQIKTKYRGESNDALFEADGKLREVVNEGWLLLPPISAVTKHTSTALAERERLAFIRHQARTIVSCRCLGHASRRTTHMSGST